MNQARKGFQTIDGFPLEVVPGLQTCVESHAVGWGWFEDLARHLEAWPFLSPGQEYILRLASHMNEGYNLGSFQPGVHMIGTNHDEAVLLLASSGSVSCSVLADDLHRSDPKFPGISLDQGQALRLRGVPAGNS